MNKYILLAWSFDCACHCGWASVAVGSCTYVPIRLQYTRQPSNIYQCSTDFWPVQCIVQEMRGCMNQQVGYAETEWAVKSE